MKKMNKKAFTLIELLVTIAVLGILVLLASPRFFGHVQNAELTKGFANAKSIEKASELYYMDYEDWPRLTDDPYTSEEIESYSERIFDRTGHEVNLDPEGNYYDIDYDKLSDYIQVPDDKKNYILQNPVGKIYYMDKLNEDGKDRVDYSNEVDGSDEIEQEYPVATSQTHFDYIINGGNATITKYKGTDKNVVIPEYIIVSGIKHPVTIIGERAFYAGPVDSWRPIRIKLESVQFPNSVETIGSRSFEDNSLKNVKFGSGIKTISSAAFWGNKLTRISLPEGLKVIQDTVFTDNELEEVSIPNSVESIGYMAFYQNNIKNVSIPDNVKSIGNNAFRYNNLSSVQIPRGLIYTATGEYRTFDTNVVVRTR